MTERTLLHPSTLLAAYSSGVFPMATDGQIYWYDPDPRAVFPLNNFHIPRRLKQTLNQAPFTITVDQNFDGVIRACAAPAPGREETWIDETIIDSYNVLHELGFAHSVEAWAEDELVGGLYGVALRGLFAGESMFSLQRDASKICLVHLVRRLRRNGFVLLDTQFMTPHLARFGAIEISRVEYKRRLRRAMQVVANFND